MTGLRTTRPGPADRRRVRRRGRMPPGVLPRRFCFTPDTRTKGLRHADQRHQTARKRTLGTRGPDPGPAPAVRDPRVPVRRLSLSSTPIRDTQTQDLETFMNDSAPRVEDLASV